jgi:hypothetical protein
MTRTLGALLLAVTALSCTENSPCPAGQQLEKGYCMQQVSPPDGAIATTTAKTNDGGSDPDAAVPVDGDLDSTAEASRAEADFGTPCTSQAECGGQVSYCALQPGVPVGYCTAPGCDSVPQICPVGWTCFDIGTFKPGEPHICLRP